MTSIEQAYVRGFEKAAKLFDQPWHRDVAAGLGTAAVAGLMTRGGLRKRLMNALLGGAAGAGISGGARMLGSGIEDWRNSRKNESAGTLQLPAADVLARAERATADEQLDSILDPLAAAARQDAPSAAEYNRLLARL